MNNSILKKGKTGIMMWAVLAVVIGIFLAVGITGCAAKTYRVDYCGSKSFYSNAKDSYRAGTAVELHFDLVATDTDYSFYLDGSTEGLDVQGTGNGFIIRFTMPEHDVKLEYETRNTMDYFPEGEAIVYAEPAEEVLSLYSDYDEFVADKTEPQVKVAFSTDSLVENFKVLALSLEDVDENGQMTFSEKQLYTLDSLTSGRPLVVTMTFYGSVPRYGISYVDQNGTERRFAVEMSGEGGSILLREF